MTKRFIFAVFSAWAVLILSSFIYYNFADEKILNDPHNKRVRYELRGPIADRNGKILAHTGPDGKRIYPLGAAAVITGWQSHKAGIGGFLETRYGERLVMKKKSQMLYFFNSQDVGDSLKTTLDARLLLAADKALGSEDGAVVVTKLNGEVLAAVWHPGFDPNTVDKAYKSMDIANGSTFFNKAIKGTFPPGSAWKIVDTIGLLDHSDKPFFCKGHVTIGDKTVRCSHPHGKIRGIRDAFVFSCNGYFITRGLGEFDVAEFVRTSGMFAGIGGTASMARKDYALALIGQGPILLTPVEAALLGAACANGGMRPQAAFLKSEVSVERVFSEEKAVKIQSFMKEVVEKGTGKGIRELTRQGYVIGLKTGTAGKDLPGGKKTNIATIVGFAGKKKPEIAFSIVVENTDKHAADACLPILKKVLAAYFGKSGK
jgi:cell division protein FtsI/penicillin-binding protein 2